MLEWLKSKRETILSVDKDLEQLELSCIAGGNAKWCHYFRSSYKVKHVFATQPSNSTPRWDYQRNENYGHVKAFI